MVELVAVMGIDVPVGSAAEILEIVIGMFVSAGLFANTKANEATGPLTIELLLVDVIVPEGSTVIPRAKHLMTLSPQIIFLVAVVSAWASVAVTDVMSAAGNDVVQPNVAG